METRYNLSFATGVSGATATLWVTLARRWGIKRRLLKSLSANTCLLCMLLLFSRCDSTPDMGPAPGSGKEAAENKGVLTSVKTVTTVDGATAQVTCSEEVLPSGEIIQICVPALWNGELILYAHGYVPAFLPLSLPDEVTAYMPLFTSIGFAFATTSFDRNGIAILTGIDNMLALRAKFIAQYGEPKHTYLTGGSQGGIITTLALERYPALFDGGLSLCGPCGYFQGQVNYYGNFRVLFDYYFPGVLPGNAIHIPLELQQNWESKYVPLVLQAINQNPNATIKLLKTALAPFDPDNPATIAETVIGVLTYDVLYTENAQRVLGGQPFDNTKQVYFGTGNFREDLRLNLRVQRFSGDKAALRTIRENYETSGDLARPLVSAHTTKDPIVLFWNMPIYHAKTIYQGKSHYFTQIPVSRYGHCAFIEQEIMLSFTTLAFKVQGQALFAKASDAEGRIVRSVTSD
ncbi:DUF6351 family protein [Pontibacter sp. E15-1]|uniref:DUF6351 family protein n=1 Tax=Pontibacter sp. E15-1 TaxID=2919918 RepID=UPI001F4F544D|nr:DUF6351 family protein [Pontibacter sp. E15-1]MCJ8164334.1 DUF6351 family protein [Pontibacter sp. E15-1]